VAARDLFDLCVEWKELCEEAVASTVGGPIDHSFVSPGAPAFDCVPQLSVNPGGPAEADTQPLSPPLVQGHRDSISGSVHLVNLTCVVLRCAPTISSTGEIPAVAAIETAARETHEDVWAIWAWTRKRHREGLLFSSPSLSRELIFDPAVPIPEQGAAVGWQIPIRVALGGYDPAA
jgi:hypothetical protein